VRSGAQLREATAKDWIDGYGICTPARREARTIDDAVHALAALHAPVAVKLISQALHKSDVGGVRLGIQDAAGLRDAIDAIDRAAFEQRIAIEGYLIEEMAPRGIEVLVGGIVDPVFGPAVVVGLGGVFTEILNDVVARICPIDADDAREMIHEMKASPLLFGARGQPAADIEALAGVLLALGGPRGLMMDQVQRIREIDLNPVIVSPHGAIAVDARIILREEAANDAG
jgi:acetyl-CoA synthetase (ADP-forming)